MYIYFVKLSIFSQEAKGFLKFYILFDLIQSKNVYSRQNILKFFLISHISTLVMNPMSNN